MLFHFFFLVNTNPETTIEQKPIRAMPAIFLVVGCLLPFFSKMPRILLVVDKSTSETQPKDTLQTSIFDTSHTGKHSGQSPATIEFQARQPKVWNSNHHCMSQWRQPSSYFPFLLK
jgi:hypothetical protein